MTKILSKLLSQLLIVCQGKSSKNNGKNKTDNSAETIRVLESHGDKAENSRDIFHWIYFGNVNNRNDFLREAQNANYTFVSQNTVDDEFPFQLKIKVNSQPSQAIIDSQILYLKEVAKKYNGDYDGWETSVEK